MASPSPSLLALPVEILVQIRRNLANIEDYKEFSSTCRTLRNICSSASPNEILRLAAASSRVFFRPDPYFLVAATANQIGQWALSSESNADRFRKSLKDGIEGLFDLCVEEAGLTMDDIRWLQASRFTIFNPVIDLIDRCAGKQWHDVEDFWNGGRSDAETVDCEPQRAFFQMAIYGALFQPSLEASLDGKEGLDLDTRLDYIKYCIPDQYCHSYRGFEVEETGPYRNRQDNVNPIMDQYSIRHILKSRKWQEAWKEARDCEGTSFPDSTRYKIWCGAIQLYGLAGYQILRPGGVDKWRDKLLELRGKLERMDTSRIRWLHGKTDLQQQIEWLKCPMLEDEIFCCVRWMWGHD